jgi:hypothetical protein
MIHYIIRRCEIVASRSSRTKYAHQLSTTLYQLENQVRNWSSKRLKIRVSVVRFRPWPPISRAQDFLWVRFFCAFPEGNRAAPVDYGHPQNTRGGS